MRRLTHGDARMLGLFITAACPELPRQLSGDVKCWDVPRPVELTDDVLVIDGHRFSVKELRETLDRLETMVTEMPEQLVLFGSAAR